MDAMLQWKIFVQRKELKILPDSLTQLLVYLIYHNSRHDFVLFLTSTIVCRGDPNDQFPDDQEMDAFMINAVSYYIIMEHRCGF